MIEGVDTSKVDPTVDDGEDRDRRPSKPCGARVVLVPGSYGFCVLPAGHDLDCLAAAHSPDPEPADFGPRRKR